MSELAEAMDDALDDAGVELMGISGMGIGAPGSIDAEAGSSCRWPTSKGWTHRFPRARAGEGARPPSRSERRKRRDQGRTPLGAGRGFDSFLSVFWGQGSAAASSSTAASWQVAARRERSAACARSPADGAATAGWRVDRGVCGPRGARGAGARAGQGAEDRPVRPHGEEGADRLTSGSGCARCRHTTRCRGADRAGGPGARCRNRLRRDTARCRGGHDRRRPRRADRAEWLQKIERATAQHTFFRERPAFGSPNSATSAAPSAPA